MPRPKRATLIDLRATIISTAWQQIAEQGAAALALREIARRMNITAPAIYHYYPSRDDLVTALITEAYAEFGEAQRIAAEDLPPIDYTGRLRALGLAYRRWAIEHPQRYQLIFGAPLPGYHPPWERTGAAAGQSLLGLVHLLEEARLAGRLREIGTPLAPTLCGQMEALRALIPVGDPYVLYIAIVIWSRVHGLTMFEISHQYPPLIPDLGQVYGREVEMMIVQYLKED